MNLPPEGTANALREAPPAAAAREVFIDGLALWTPAWPGWEAAAPALRRAPDDATPQVDAGPVPAARPAPGGLAPNERRRAPDSVLVALQVAEQAVAMSGHDARTLASVFASAHGDLPIVDALARTLAGDPRLLSPTRFHHSVHNAPSGYWAIASGSHAASTAIAAFDHTFGAGLLEALAQVACDDAPVLLAGCDTGAEGPLASVNGSRGLLGAALVLAPRPGPRGGRALHWRLGPSTGPSAPPASALGRALARNALADALPLFEALASDATTELALRCGPGLALHLAVQVRPCSKAG